MPDDIESLPGVGPKTAEKLVESGFDNYMTLAASSAGEIMEATGLGEDTANKVILAAREKLNMGFETGIEVMEKRQKERHLFSWVPVQGLWALEVWRLQAVPPRQPPCLNPTRTMPRWARPYPDRRTCMERERPTPLCGHGL